MLVSSSLSFLLRTDLQKALSESCPSPNQPAHLCVHFSSDLSVTQQEKVWSPQDLKSVWGQGAWREGLDVKLEGEAGQDKKGS